MLSNEERKAINQLKADTSFYDYELKNGNYIYELFKIEVYKKDIDVILNLIEKQSKEIEELKTTKKELTERVLRLESDKFWDNVVSKNKIKAKKEELKKECKNCEFRKFLCKQCFTEKGISILESLEEE